MDRAWLRSLVHTSRGPCRSGPEEGQVSFLGAASLTCHLSQSSIITDLSSSLGFCWPSDFVVLAIGFRRSDLVVARIWLSLGFSSLGFLSLGFRHSDFCRSLGFHRRHLCTSLWYATVCIAIDCDFAGTISNYQLFRHSDFRHSDFRRSDFVARISSHRFLSLARISSPSPLYLYGMPLFALLLIVILLVPFLITSCFLKYLSVSSLWIFQDSAKGFLDFTVLLDFAITCQVPRLVRAPVYCCMTLSLPCLLSSYTNVKLAHLH